MKSKKVMKTVLIMCIVTILVIGGYYILIQYSEKKNAAGSDPTEIEKLIEKDMENEYPAVPTEVVKLYNRFNKCIYNTKLSEENFDALLTQMRLLYDDELLKENAFETQKEKLQKEVTSYMEEKKAIVTTSVQENSQVKYEEVEEKECASLVTSYLIKEKDEYTKTYEQFILRKDSKGNWKILGWSQSNEAAMKSTN